MLLETQDLAHSLLEKLQKKKKKPERKYNHGFFFFFSKSLVKHKHFKLEFSTFPKQGNQYIAIPIWHVLAQCDIQYKRRR